MNQLTLAHITHEAVEKIGGIGSVLEGFITSPIYQQHVQRTILVGPANMHVAGDPRGRLGPDGEILYSTVDGIDEVGHGVKLRPIEYAFDVAITYGIRNFEIPGDTRRGTAEVLLLDVFRTNPDRLAMFKLRLWETFGIDSSRYEHEWGYEEYVRLAEPAFYSLVALLDEDELPCVMFSHEFMGMPAALKAELDGANEFRTIFHGHECATARHLVENHPGHDLTFYNAVREARTHGRYVEDVFGDLSFHFRHQLISRAHVCDGVIAVGDHTAEEIHFLGRQFDHHHIDLVYNGVPAMKVAFEDQRHSRTMLQDYCERLVNWRPDVLLTHVTRPVISKGIWRDLAVCHHLNEQFAADGTRGVLIILTSAGGVRRPHAIQAMEAEYDWPRHHHVGYPDLVGPEIDFNHMIEAFNANHDRLQVILVNQFGWSPELIGNQLPADMDIADLRRATDVEFGMATYEPFGISPLEPLGAGAVCVISAVCGCAGFVDHVTNGQPVDNVVVADYTALDHHLGEQEILDLSQSHRDDVESRVAAEIAHTLMSRIPRTDDARRKLITSGQQLVGRMGWDQVIDQELIPMLHRVIRDEQPAPLAVPA
ncbi:MAG: hypothetical protein CMJ49_13705 [Planctomycetaceae bacterium]|nr:hypothetical protein [Planctomycetaceae bacterium]